jgi:hypothetical protein
MNKKSKNNLAMTVEELACETSEFDGGATPKGRTLDPATRARWEKARAGGSASLYSGPGRPKVGEGAVPVPISVEAGLLRRAIANAAALGLKRSEYFAKALQLLTDGYVEVGGRRLIAQASGQPAKVKHTPHKRTRAAG